MRRRVPANVRVEARSKSYNGQTDIDALLRKFKKACHEAKIPHLIKTHEYYMKPCDVRRNKNHKRLLTIQKSLNPPKKKEEETQQFNAY
jgi:small subunit ribosomal protein S21